MNGEERTGRSRPLFDPVAGMRAVADIQAEGLRAAGELLERMLRTEPDDGGGGGGARSPAGDYTALVDAWTDLLRSTVAGLAGVADRGAVTVAVDVAGVGPPVRLALPASGGEAATEVWLHNGTASEVGPLALRCGPLADADGTVLDGPGVRFEPDSIELLPSRSSRAVAVSLAATTRARAGTYRGAIQARGAPALWLPLEVTVAPC